MQALSVIVNGVLPMLINAAVAVVAGGLLFLVVEYLVHPLLRRTS